MVLGNLIGRQWRRVAINAVPLLAEKLRVNVLIETHVNISDEFNVSGVYSKCKLYWVTSIV